MKPTHTLLHGSAPPKQANADLGSVKGNNTAAEMYLRQRRRADSRFAYAALTPAFVILIGFTIIPFVLSVFRSVQSNSGELTTANYERMASDGVFQQAL